jgi:hypothetical protein
MRSIVVQVGPLAAPSANNIAASQTPSGAGNLTLSAGAIAGTTPDKPRRVLFTPAGAEGGNGTIWTIYGTDWNNTPISETVTAVDNPSTVYTVYDYKTVTRIAVNKAQAGAVTVGTNGIASSRPIFMDPWGLPTISLQVTASGTINYTVQQTLDDPNSPTNPVAYTSVTWVNNATSAFVSTTATAQGSNAFVPRMFRLLVNSNTNPAYAVMTVIQPDVVAL